MIKHDLRHRKAQVSVCRHTETWYYCHSI